LEGGVVGPFGVLETKWFLMGVFSISMLWLRSSSSKLGLGFQLSGESIVLLKIVEVTWAKVVVISDHAKHVVDCYKTTIHVCVMLYLRWVEASLRLGMVAFNAYTRA